MTVLFIYRRDLRVHDNIGLNKAIELCKEHNEKLVTIFIFTPEQVSDKNTYKSQNAISFMINSLNELSKVQCFYGTNEDVLTNIFKKGNINHLVFNTDTTPYAQKRDLEIVQLCDKFNVNYHLCQDYNLHDLSSIKTGSDTDYEVFTPFFNKASKLEVNKPDTLYGTKYYEEHITSKFTISLSKAKDNFIDVVDNIIVKGGRSEGLRLLNKTQVEQKKYDSTRNEAKINTSNLSAHIKFGTLSIREVYYHFKKHNMHSLVQQLYWNEFYDYLIVTLPYKKTLGKSNYKGLHIKWKNDNKLFKAWREGKTGFPFIDAGMRQLNIEGYMHNRARMAVANFLSMILLIDWRKGEQYFATKLTDYDVAQNNGNWQWSSGVGVDRTSFLRIYNPYTQSKKHDEDCVYIKKYVGELQNIENKIIHKWETENEKHDVYIKPVVNYSDRRKLALDLWKK